MMTKSIMTLLVAVKTKRGLEELMKGLPMDGFTKFSSMESLFLL